MLLERRLREWLDIRGNPQAVKAGWSAASPRSGSAVERQFRISTYCAQCQDQDQGSDMHECVVGALVARATFRLRVGRIVALRELSQEPLGRERRPGDICAQTRPRSASTALRDDQQRAVLLGRKSGWRGGEQAHAPVASWVRLFILRSGRRQ